MELLLGTTLRFLGLLHACSVAFDSATPWTVAHQAPLPMEFSKQENWSGLSLFDFFPAESKLMGRSSLPPLCVPSTEGVILKNYPWPHANRTRSH